MRDPTKGSPYVACGACNYFEWGGGLEAANDHDKAHHKGRTTAVFGWMYPRDPKWHDKPWTPTVEGTGRRDYYGSDAEHLCHMMHSDVPVRKIVPQKERSKP